MSYASMLLWRADEVQSRDAFALTHALNAASPDDIEKSTCRGILCGKRYRFRIDTYNPKYEHPRGRMLWDRGTSFLHESMIVDLLRNDIVVWRLTTAIQPWEQAGYIGSAGFLSDGTGRATIALGAVEWIENCYACNLPDAIYRIEPPSSPSEKQRFRSCMTSP